MIYHSLADDIAEDDVDGMGSSLRLDRKTGRTTVLVTSKASRFSNGANPDVTAKGWVAFMSKSRLDPQDTKPNNDVYVMRFRSRG